MHFRKAQKDDIEMILKIFEQAQNSLKQQGIDQWQNGYPNYDMIQQDIEKGVCHIFENDNGIFATVSFITDLEPSYENIEGGAWKTSGRYGTVHRLAVLESERGKGFAGAIFAKLELMCRLKSIASIRTDTHRENRPMQRTLQKSGFEYCGVIYLADDSERLAFEKVIL